MWCSNGSASSTSTRACRSRPWNPGLGARVRAHGARRRALCRRAVRRRCHCRDSWCSGAAWLGRSSSASPPSSQAVYGGGRASSRAGTCGSTPASTACATSSCCWPRGIAGAVLVALFLSLAAARRRPTRSRRRPGRGRPLAGRRRHRHRGDRRRSIASPRSCASRRCAMQRAARLAPELALYLPWSPRRCG